MQAAITRKTQVQETELAGKEQDLAKREAELGAVERAIVDRRKELDAEAESVQRRAREKTKARELELQDQAKVCPVRSVLCVC